MGNLSLPIGIGLIPMGKETIPTGTGLGPYGNLAPP